MKTFLAAIGGFAVMLIVVGIISGVVKSSTSESSDATVVSPESKKVFYKTFYNSCYSESKESDYCSCVGHNLIDDITPSVLDEMKLADDQGSASMANFLAPYISGCEDKI